MRIHKNTHRHPRQPRAAGRRMQNACRRRSRHDTHKATHETDTDAHTRCHDDHTAAGKRACVSVCSAAISTRIGTSNHIDEAGAVHARSKRRCRRTTSVWPEAVLWLTAQLVIVKAPDPWKYAPPPACETASNSPGSPHTDKRTTRLNDTLQMRCISTR